LPGQQMPALPLAHSVAGTHGSAGSGPGLVHSMTCGMFCQLLFTAPAASRCAVQCAFASQCVQYTRAASAAANACQMQS
jgi:hypothetical protein